MAWSPERQMERNMEFFAPEAVQAREDRRQGYKRELEGTYAQRAADDVKMKGTFDQNAALRKRMEGTYDQRAMNEFARHGTFDQNAKLRRELEGTYGQRVVDETNAAAMQGDLAMDRAAYIYGPNSVEAKKVGLMGDELDLKRRAEMGTLLARVREDSVKLFPDDPKKAAEYYSQESKKVTSMFPETMPKLSALSDQLHGTDTEGASGQKVRGAIPAPGPPPPERPVPASGPSARQKFTPSPSPDGHDYFAPDPIEAKLKSALGTIGSRLNRGSSMFGAREMPIPDGPSMPVAQVPGVTVSAPIPGTQAPVAGSMTPRTPIPGTQAPGSAIRSPMPNFPAPGGASSVSGAIPQPGAPVPQRPRSSINPFVSVAFAGDGIPSGGPQSLNDMAANPWRKRTRVPDGEIYHSRSMTSPPGK